MIGSFFSGMVMEKMQSEAGYMQKFLILVPLMNSQGGSIGSCVASRLSTLQNQQRERPHANADRRKSRELDEPALDRSSMLFMQTLTLIACSCTVLFIVCSILFNSLFDSILHLLFTMTLMAIVLTTASTFIALIALAVSERYGLDPDSTTVPIVCAMMDSIARYTLSCLFP